MKKMLGALSLCTALTVSASVSAATFGLPTINWFAPKTQAVTQTNTETNPQATDLIQKLIAAVPQLAGQAMGQSFTQSLGNLGQPTSGQAFNLKLAEGLNVSLADIKLAPIGASIIFDFDNYALTPASGNSPAIYTTGAVSGAFKYNTVTKKIGLTLDSINDEPVTYSGGQLEGNTLEFDNLTITVNTSSIVPFWEDRVKVEGRIYVNGTEVPVEDIVNLIKLIQKTAG